MLKTIKAVLGFEGVGNTALKIVDKIAGTDWTPDKKAEFILAHAAATKHQSPTRRVLAISIMAEQVMLVTVWTIATIIGRGFAVEGMTLLATDIHTMLTSTVNLALNGILAFYFLIGMRK